MRRGLEQMAKQADPQKKQDLSKQEPVLKGTFVSVMLLGVFLVVTWVSVFVLFVSRQ